MIRTVILAALAPHCSHPERPLRRQWHRIQGLHDQGADQNRIRNRLRDRPLLSDGCVPVAGRNWHR